MEVLPAESLWQICQNLDDISLLNFIQTHKMAMQSCQPIIDKRLSPYLPLLRWLVKSHILIDYAYSFRPNIPQEDLELLSRPLSTEDYIINIDSTINSMDKYRDPWNGNNSANSYNINQRYSLSLDNGNGNLTLIDELKNTTDIFDLAQPRNFLIHLKKLLIESTQYIYWKSNLYDEEAFRLIDLNYNVSAFDLIKTLKNNGNPIGTYYGTYFRGNTPGFYTKIENSIRRLYIQGLYLQQVYLYALMPEYFSNGLAASYNNTVTKLKPEFILDYPSIDDIQNANIDYGTKLGALTSFYERSST